MRYETVDNAIVLPLKLATKRGVAIIRNFRGDFNQKFKIQDVLF